MPFFLLLTSDHKLSLKMKVQDNWGDLNFRFKDQTENQTEK